MWLEGGEGRWMVHGVWVAGPVGSQHRSLSLTGLGVGADHGALINSKGALHGEHELTVKGWG